MIICGNQLVVIRWGWGLVWAGGGLVVKTMHLSLMDFILREP